MTTTGRYFLGKGSDLGNVSGAPLADFPALCAFLKEPVRLRLTRDAFHALGPKERGVAKRTDYLTAATFTTSPCPRRTENAGPCNLIALDVDDSRQASRLIQPDGLSALAEFGVIAWHTASSTAEHPRLRILVHAEALPLAEYRDAARTIGEMLGLPTVTSESLVPVQPMFLPVQFEGETASPVFYCQPDGMPFVKGDVSSEAAVDEGPRGEDAGEDAGEEETVGDLDNYRTPLEGATLDDAKDALSHLDPDMAMQGWIEMGAALKHQFGEEGYALWDAWSARGKKYVSSDETAYRWKTLKAQPTDRIPVTIRSLFKLAQEAGWKNSGIAKRAFEEANAWLRAASRSTEELLDQGAKRIAAVASVVGPMERKALVVGLKDALKARDMPLSVGDIRQAMKEAEKKTNAATGDPAWTQGICYLTSSNIFYRFNVDRRFKPEVIDLLYGNGGQFKPRDYLIHQCKIPQVENWRYDPSQRDANGAVKRFFMEGNVPFVNTYRASKVQSDPSRSREAGDLIQTHIANLIAEPEYQRLFIDFLAYHFQSPGKKVNWAPLLQSTQGTGKTAIAYLMSVLLGRGNVKKVSNANVMEGAHNEWCYGAQLAVLDEVRIVGQNRHAVMDKLKPCITDDEVPLRAMFEGPRTVPNTQNYLLFTNYQDALAIQDDDRRYFVLASPLQHPEQVEALGGAAYFTKFFDHLRDNPGGLKHFFETWPISAEFKPRGRAPVTKYLRELVRNAASPLAAAVMQAIEDEPHPLVRKDLVSLQSLRDAIDVSQVSGYSDQGLSAVLREMGWHKAGRVMIDNQRHTLWARKAMTDPIGTAMVRMEVL